MNCFPLWNCPQVLQSGEDVAQGSAFLRSWVQAQVNFSGDLHCQGCQLSLFMSHPVLAEQCPQNVLLRGVVWFWCPEYFWGVECIWRWEIGKLGVQRIRAQRINYLIPNNACVRWIEFCAWRCVLRECMVFFPKLFGEVWFRGALNDPFHNLESLRAVGMKNGDRWKLSGYGEEVIQELNHCCVFPGDIGSLGCFSVAFEITVERNWARNGWCEWSNICP